MVVSQHVHERASNNITDSDPDIAGLGIILAFLISAWLSLALAVIAYLFALPPPSVLKNYDHLFTYTVLLPRPSSRLQLSKSKIWARTLERMVLALSDQQIVTGIAILVAGFTKIRTISMYHWQVIVYLAWMSSNVHLTSLSYLRIYLQRNRKLRAFRVGAMSVLFLLLFVALYPTCDTRWAVETSGKSDLPSQIPARIFWTGDEILHDGYSFGPDGRVRIDAIVAYIFLTVSYVWKILMLYDRSRDTLRDWTRTKPLHILERAIQRQATRPRRRGRGPAYKFLVSNYIIILALSDLAVSFAGSLWLVTIGLIWGSLQVLIPRRGVPDDMYSEESAWGFGQILPMLFLILPFIGMAESLHDAKDDHDGSGSNDMQLNTTTDHSEMMTNLVEEVEIYESLSHRTTLRNDTSDPPPVSTISHKSNSRALSMLFVDLDFDQNYGSAIQALHSAIYQSWTFKAIIIFLNLIITAAAIMFFVLYTLLAPDWAGIGIVAIGGGSFILTLSLLLPLTWSRSKLFR